MTSTTHKNKINYPEYSCPRCKGFGWKIGFYRDAGGQPKYPFVCAGCDLQTKHFAKRAAVEAADIEVKKLHSRVLPAVCEVCGVEGAENHHWAPEALFGSESASWPTSYLCQKCHSRWHQLVTQNANGAKKT